MKSKKGVIPAGFANGGKVKDSKAEEKREMKMVGKKMPPAQRARMVVEEKAEGEPMPFRNGGRVCKKANGGRVKKGC